MLKLHADIFRASQAAALTLAVFSCGWSLASAGTTSSSAFTVKVQFTPASKTPSPPGLPISAFCKKNNIPSGHGAVVTVVCTTGAVVAIEPGRDGQPFNPVHGGAYRYVANVSPNGDLSNTVDAFGGAGTTTAWRVVKSTNREYLEMTLGW